MPEPPRRRQVTPPPSDEATLLGQLTATSARLETEVATVRSDISELRTSLTVHSESLEQVAGQARDLTLIKRLAAGLLAVLLPLLATAGYQAIVASQRLEHLGEQLTKHEAKRGHNGTLQEIGEVQRRMDVAAAEQRHTTQGLEKLQKTLDRIEREGVPTRRRRRTP